MEHKRLRHTGEEVKAKKVTSSGVRVRARDTCTRETGLLDEVQAQRERRGADDAALLSDIGRFFSATAASVGIDALSPTEYRPPFRRLPNRHGERHKQRAEASPSPTRDRKNTRTDSTLFS